MFGYSSKKRYESMKKPLNKIFTYDQIKDLARSKPAPENFGPDTDYPYIAIRLERSTSEILRWLTKLSCPVIGIGDGGLSKACDSVIENDSELAALDKNIRTAPLAALILVQHLRASEGLSLTNALMAESFAYGTIQNGPEFKTWLAQNHTAPLPTSLSQDIEVARIGTKLSIAFNRPDTRNAIGISMRDALCEALDLAQSDPDITTVFLTGNGATFSTGGAVEEFGQATDPATAHWVRSLRLPAARLVEVHDKLSIHVNGAAIGAGAEIAAFGSHVTASSKSWFQLPELKYGLIPGAGGTASIRRRIGRQKTAYMALSMKKIRAKKALSWGLIDAIVD